MIECFILQIDSENIFWMKMKGMWKFSFLQPPIVCFEGKNNDIQTRWISLPPLESPCQEIFIKYLMQYQNRGSPYETPGFLTLRLVRDGVSLEEVDIGVSTKIWQTYALRIKGVITRKSQVGDVYEVHRTVGGSGLLLLVRDFAIGLSGPLISPPLGSQQYDVVLPPNATGGAAMKLQTPYYRPVRSISAFT